MEFTTIEAVAMSPHSAGDLRMNAGRTFDEHRIERLRCAEIRLEVERNERLTYIPDTLLHKAGHFAGIHPEMLTRRRGMRSW